jgi:predicted nucleic acid-binding protein
VVPTLLLVEVARVISRTRGDAALGSRYAETMRQLPFIQWVPLDEAMAVRASALAATRALRGADAVYAAVAVAYGCELVSLDREHLTRLPPVLRHPQV